MVQMRLDTCTQSHQSNVNAYLCATCEAINIISGTYINKTCTQKKSHDICSDEYLLNISIISNLLIS